MEKLNKTLKLNPLYEADGYKVGHKAMLADNTTREAFTWIPRSVKYMHPSITTIMSTGQQLVWRYIHSNFQESFFNQPIEVATQFGKDMSKYLMMDYNASHFEELHKLGYLPITIQSLEEGIFTKQNIPHMQGITEKGFAWLGLFLETLMSKLAWQMPTAATIAAKFKENAVKAVLDTDKDNLWLADFMCHDFHSRGGNPFTSIAVGLGHALSNKGSDTLNVIPASRYYYDFDEEDVPVYSVNASEHSVTCTGIFYYEKKLRDGKLNNEIYKYYSFNTVCDGSIEEPDYLAIAEYLNLRDWLKKFPKGILSVVSDTMDLWKVITHILPRLKEEILSREGKLVIRPDSGDPVNITCGESIRTIDADSYEEFLEFAQEELHEEIYENTPHGEYGGDISDMFYFNNKLYEVTYSPDWNRHDKRYYFIDNYGDDHTTAIEVDSSPSDKGVVELLWDIFGGTINEQGYKVLDSHIGAIYGDSINLERQTAIYSRLKDKKFAATNIVVGVGSYTYVMLTRDSAGYAAKGSWFETEDEEETTAYNIYKDPITDNGTKKSLKGFQFVHTNTDGEIQVESEVSEKKAFSEENMLKVIYSNGKFFNQTTLIKIRERLNG